MNLAEQRGVIDTYLYLYIYFSECFEKCHKMDRRSQLAQIPYIYSPCTYI